MLTHKLHSSQLLRHDYVTFTIVHGLIMTHNTLHVSLYYVVKAYCLIVASCLNDSPLQYAAIIATCCYHSALIMTELNISNMR
jgi:hypothetical protein